MTERSRPKPDRYLLAAVLAIGVAMRAVMYFSRPSLLMDEVRLSLNVAARPWSGLLRPLDYDQTAPPLFLLMEKLATVVGGVNEYSLRAIPFLASVALLPLVYAVARKVLTERAAVLAVAITAFSPLFLEYTRQAKPYSTDVVVALCLTAWAFDWAAAPQNRGRARRLLLGGLVAVWLSAPAVLVLIGIAAALGFSSPPGRPPRRLLLASAGVWLASFGIAYLWVYRPAAVDPYMQQFWSAGLVRLWKAGAWWRLWHAAREIVWQTFVGGTTEPPLRPGDNLLVSTGTLAFLSLGSVGLGRLIRDTRVASWGLLFAPGLAVLAASSAGQYPLGARLMLFAVPALIIAVVAGLGAVGAVSPARRGVVAALAGVCVLAPAWPLDVSLVAHPTAFEPVRAAVQQLERESTPGDAIYVFAATIPAWTFYTTDWNAPDTSRLARMARLASSGGPAFENAAPRGRAIGLEGDSLVFPLGRAREVIGLYHGAQARHVTGLVQQVPDTNWTTNEARRIRAAATPTIWVLMSHTYGLERFLLPAVDLCLDRLFRDDGVVLARYTRSPPAEAHCLRNADPSEPGAR